MSNMGTDHLEAFTCIVCGDSFGLNARLEKFLAGHGDSVAANHCWVCARLRQSAIDERRDEHPRTDTRQ